MLTTRQSMILKYIVEDFIKTAQPVGSNTLMNNYHLPYSSATIRNEMVVSENAGYLEKTHTSSGRVPSTEGYRYYVENLMDPVISGEKNEVATAFDIKGWSFEDAIQKSCDVVSRMTSLTSVVLGPEANTRTLRHIKMFPIDETTAVAVFIADNGHTENKTFHFDESVSVDDITKCTEIMNDRLSGTKISEITKKMKEIKPILAQEVRRSEILFNAFFQAFVKFASQSVYYSGAGNMLYQPEFSDVEKLKDMVRLLEDSSAWKQIAENAQSVSESDEGKVLWIDDYAIASHPVEIPGTGDAQLMVVGPKRMNYEEVLKVLNEIAGKLEAHYGKKKKKG